MDTNAYIYISYTHTHIYIHKCILQCTHIQTYADSLQSRRFWPVPGGALAWLAGSFHHRCGGSRWSRWADQRRRRRSPLYRGPDADGGASQCQRPKLGSFTKRLGVLAIFPLILQKKRYVGTGARWRMVNLHKSAQIYSRCPPDPECNYEKLMSNACELLWCFLGSNVGREQQVGSGWVHSTLVFRLPWQTAWFSVWLVTRFKASTVTSIIQNAQFQSIPGFGFWFWNCPIRSAPHQKCGSGMAVWTCQPRVRGRTSPAPGLGDQWWSPEHLVQAWSRRDEAATVRVRSPREIADSLVFLWQNKRSTATDHVLNQFTFHFSVTTWDTCHTA